MTTYHIHRAPRRLPRILAWWDFPFCVCKDPHGDPCRFVGNASTLRGARRIIRREQARAEQPPYWETPIVDGADT